jgi:hypothetical protein
MKASALKYRVLSVMLGLITVIVILLPFHGFLTVWAASLFGHYTAVRLWKELLAAICVLGVLYLVCFDHKVRHHTLSRKLTWLILLYAVVQLVWGFVALQKHTVDAKALAYGLLLNLRFVGFFLITWALAVRTERLEARWPKLLLWPSVVVVAFGLLQVFVLPTDFLRHFGYGPSTIPPYETINHNLHYIRYASTLRGANPLGAYLILPISALVVLLVRYPRSWNWTKGLLLAGSLVMLYFSFSRSAWIGAVLSVLTVLIGATQSAFLRKYRTILISAVVVVVVVIAGLAIGLHDSQRFQNIIFHTQTNSAVNTNSDGGHLSALRSGVHDIVHDPLGRGPGSAGPASTYNNHPGRIAEDYFIQIGQETGVIGLVLFVGINLIVGYLLWVRRAAPLALTLFAALIGITFVNFLSHAWTDDTLSYIWWGLAGIAIATPVIRPKKNAK